MSDISVRINFRVGEIAVSGPKEVVDEYLDRYSELADVQPEPARKALPSETNEVPDEFGAYLQLFPTSVSDVDRALIAANFVQRGSQEDSFSTRELNQQLVEQGIRLSNPSESVRQNVRSRRAFALSRGRFRVSKQGVAHLSTLQGGN